MKKMIQLLSLFMISLFSLNTAFATETTLASGSLNAGFSSWGKASLQGDWKIVETDGKQFIELSDNFKAKEGPDVKVFLSPLNSAEITGDNAATDSVFIKLITTFEGMARIEIPASVNLSQYQSLVFHCEEYSKLWGTSALTKAN